MPPRNTFTKNDVVNAAYSIMLQYGATKLSARNIAQRLNSSTGPVYQSFSSMSDLEREVLWKGEHLLVEYTAKDYTNRVFLNMGVGIVVFARDNRQIFRSIFLEEHDYQDIIDDFFKKMREQFDKDDRFSHLSDDVKSELLKKMWIFTHGLASLASVGLFQDDSDESIIKILDEVGTKLIGSFISISTDNTK